MRPRFPAEVFPESHTVDVIGFNEDVATTDPLGHQSSQTPFDHRPADPTKPAALNDCDVVQITPPAVVTGHRRADDFTIESANDAQVRIAIEVLCDSCRSSPTAKSEMPFMPHQSAQRVGDIDYSHRPEVEHASPRERSMP